MLFAVGGVFIYSRSLGRDRLWLRIARLWSCSREIIEPSSSGIVRRGKERSRSRKARRGDRGS